MIWKCIKGALSVFLLAIAATFIWLGMTRTIEPWLIGVVSLLIFMAALPWVNLLRPSRALGMVGVMLSLLMLGIGVHNLSSPGLYPLDCTARRGLFCYVENLLFELGGPILAAMPLLLPGTFLLVGSVRLTWRRLLVHGDHRW